MHDEFAERGIDVEQIEHADIRRIRIQYRHEGSDAATLALGGSSDQCSTHAQRFLLCQHACDHRDTGRGKLLAHGHRRACGQIVAACAH